MPSDEIVIYIGYVWHHGEIQNAKAGEREVGEVLGGPVPFGAHGVRDRQCRQRQAGRKRNGQRLQMVGWHLLHRCHSQAQGFQL